MKSKFPPDKPPKAERVDHIQNWIPMDECQDGRLYRIECRNAQWGIYRAEENGFVIARRHNHDGVRIDDDGSINEFEAGDLYQFVEKHWETGSPHGTAKPLQLIESVEAPDFELLTSLPDTRRDQGIKHQFDVERFREAQDQDKEDGSC